MHITERLATLLNRFKHGDQQPFVNEYLGGMLVDVRDKLDAARDTEDMLRYQGATRILKQILSDIDNSDKVLDSMKNQRRNKK